MMDLDLVPLVLSIFDFPPENLLVLFSGVGFGNFVPAGIESLGDVVTLVIFVLRGVESKYG